MHPSGFPENLVQVTVRELLNVGFFLFLFFFSLFFFFESKKWIYGVLAQVYGGDEGWVFIKDTSYSLLLETLLEKTNGPQQEVELELFLLYANKYSSSSSSSSFFFFFPSHAI